MLRDCAGSKEFDACAEIYGKSYAICLNLGSGTLMCTQCARKYFKDEDDYDDYGNSRATSMFDDFTSGTPAAGVQPGSSRSVQATSRAGNGNSKLPCCPGTLAEALYDHSIHLRKQEKCVLVDHCHEFEISTKVVCLIHSNGQTFKETF